ncbi:hypothetical protein N665_0093s0074 [Sinapis alba]|nr:hypothetical protein N665_0093s0074 [Sinapis alba]
MGVPQKLLFSLLISDGQPVCLLNKVFEMGFYPTTLKFVRALQIFYDLRDETIQEKVNVYKRLGFAVEDVWEMIKKYPLFLNISEKKILNSFETFAGLGFNRDEIMMMVKNFPVCLNYSAESAKQKTKFVVLEYNLEKTTVPRCNVIRALMSRRLLGRSVLPPIASVLSLSDQAF